jgi:hypothetical protein
MRFVLVLVLVRVIGGLTGVTCGIDYEYEHRCAEHEHER